MSSSRKESWNLIYDSNVSPMSHEANGGRGNSGLQDVPGIFIVFATKRDWHYRAAHVATDSIPNQHIKDGGSGKEEEESKVIHHLECLQNVSENLRTDNSEAPSSANVEEGCLWNNRESW